MFLPTLVQHECLPAYVTLGSTRHTHLAAGREQINESKSQIKAYDAAMTDAAFLCTDALPYADVPHDASIKVKTEYEWRESLCALVEDQALRQRLAGRLKTWCLDEWEIDRHIHKWVDLYDEIYARGPITGLDEIVRPSGQPVAATGGPNAR